MKPVKGGLPDDIIGSVDSCHVQHDRMPQDDGPNRSVGYHGSRVTANVSKRGDGSTIPDVAHRSWRIFARVGGAPVAVNGFPVIPNPRVAAGPQGQLSRGRRKVIEIDRRLQQHPAVIQSFARVGPGPVRAA